MQSALTRHMELEQHTGSAPSQDTPWSKAPRPTFMLTPTSLPWLLFLSKVKVEIYMLTSLTCSLELIIFMHFCVLLITLCVTVKAFTWTLIMRGSCLLEKKIWARWLLGDLYVDIYQTHITLTFNTVSPAVAICQKCYIQLHFHWLVLLHLPCSNPALLILSPPSRRPVLVK